VRKQSGAYGVQRLVLVNQETQASASALTTIIQSVLIIVEKNGSKSNKQTNKQTNNLHEIDVVGLQLGEAACDGLVYLDGRVWRGLGSLTEPKLGGDYRILPPAL